MVELRLGAPPLDGLAQEVLEALPHRACLIGPDGCVVAVNGRFRDVVFDALHAPAKLRVGDHVPTRFREVAGTPADFASGLAVFADAIEDVLSGRRREFQRETAAPYGPGHWELLRVSALPGGSGALLLALDISALVHAESRLAHVAAHDPLTGLPNRAHLLGRVEAALARDALGLVAVVELDLDRFSSVNASLGTQGADRLLTALARRLVLSAAPGVVARTGDDSFAVLLDDVTEPAWAVAEAERLLGVVAEPFDVEGQELTLTATSGVAVAEPGSISADELLRDAEVACGRAKQRARGSIVVAQHAERTAAVHRANIEQALRRAVERGELWLEYQPEVDLRSGHVLGAEALLRWSNPSLGALAPDEFLGVAEEAGLIGAIGQWVLVTACREAASWELPAGPDVFVAVNIASHQLGDPGLPAAVEDALHAAGLDARRLCLEVNESAVVASWDLARTNLDRLRRLGVQIALDDFGTGYSSFAHLVRLPVDIIKIDRSLIERVAADPVERAVVESVVTLARRLGLRVVAEGAEEDETVEVLRALGCDAVQGYGSGRPVNAEALLDAVRLRATAR